MSGASSFGEDEVYSTLVSFQWAHSRRTVRLRNLTCIHGSYTIPTAGRGAAHLVSIRRQPMSRRSLWGIGVVLSLAFCAVAQAQEAYLDEYVAHVRPEKRSAYDALIKKLVAANRDRGDTWTALE